MQLMIELVTLPFKVLFFPFKVLSWLFGSESNNATADDFHNHDFARMRNQQSMRDLNNHFNNQQMQRGAEASRRTHQQAVDYSRKQADISRSYRSR